MADLDGDISGEFEDSGDDNSFYGFEDDEEHFRQESDESDVDFDGIESEDEDNPAPPSTDSDPENEQEEEQWTDRLTDFQIPDFQMTAEIRFPLPAVPKEIDFFSAFFGDDLWDQIVAETNRYARQKLTTAPDRLAKFTEVTRLEMKAYFGVRIIMGMVRLPSIAAYWCTDDFFGNVGIKKVMTKNRFQEITSYLHFNDSTQEPPREAATFDRLYKYMPAKPTKYGIKVWMAADSSNGYVLNFNTYLGRKIGQSLTHGLGYHVVTSPLEADLVAQRRGRQDIAKPAVVGLYNSHMGGVDLSDQFLEGASKRKKIDSLSLDPENAGKHFVVKIKGRKRGCVQCKKNGSTTPKGRTIESTFECLQCGVALCKMDCFRDYHQG
ncbi:hypothetical protein QZH41_001777 [Actinostola sp. cb2023]|nr:hypothetical protein QZH41_001777 [Actinostola sp. cb2023]